VDIDWVEDGDRKRPPSRRPEPEGGNSTLPVLFTPSEFERIINSKEPLFSDVDLSGDDDLPPPPPRPQRSGSRLRAAAAAAAGGGADGALAGIFIPCTQLGINSNTMIKYAIIGTELQNVSKLSYRVSTAPRTSLCHLPTFLFTKIFTRAYLFQHFQFSCLDTTL
jgi:hypothetical protein